MKTWKQGRIGRINFENLSQLYVKCLKYPLAQFYRKYDSVNGLLDKYLFEIQVDLSVLKYIEILKQEKLTNEERKKESTNSKIFDLKELYIKCKEMENRK